jgi:hypothetical protein
MFILFAKAIGRSDGAARVSKRMFDAGSQDGNEKPDCNISAC